MRKTGVGWLIISYSLLIYTSLAAPAYARAHPYLGPSMLAAYAAPWPVALACALALAGSMLALIPVRRRDRWAIWTSLLMWIVLFFTRIKTDPRCLGVLDPHQHGCHSFMIAALLAVIGLALAWR
jgi:hypothetical protein